MGGNRGRCIALVIAGALTWGLTACGVPLQESAEPLPSNALPAPLRIPTPAPTPSPSGTPDVTPSASPEPTEPRLRLWFVQDDGLAAVESGLPIGSTPDLVLQSLAIGPTPDEASQGLRTVARDPLTGQPLVYVVASLLEPSASSSNSATVGATGPSAAPTAGATSPVIATVSPAFSALPPQEQVLLLGQVVLSLAGAGEQSVAFVDDSGSLLAVPLPDGRLLDLPATARDYASLIVRP